MTSFRLRGLVPLLVLGMLSGCAGERDTTVSAEEDVQAVRGVLSQIQQTFNAADLDAFMPVFTDDATIMSQGMPDVVGQAAIRGLYESALAQADMKVTFDTQEIDVFGDLAYERGTYTVLVSDKASGQKVAEVQNRHIHVFRRQPDGSWKTWRMMTNSAVAPPAPAAAPATN